VEEDEMSEAQREAAEHDAEEESEREAVEHDEGFEEQRSVASERRWSGPAPRKSRRGGRNRAGLGLDVGDTKQRRARGTRGTKRGPVYYKGRPVQPEDHHHRDRQQGSRDSQASGSREHRHRPPAIGAAPQSSRDWQASRNKSDSRASNWKQGSS
jgi:hypothetical protein